MQKTTKLSTQCLTPNKSASRLHFFSLLRFTMADLFSIYLSAVTNMLLKNDLVKLKSKFLSKIKLYSKCLEKKWIV